MNGELSTNKKIKILLVPLLCLSASKLTTDSKDDGYSKDFINDQQYSSLSKFSSTNNIVLFREKSIEANYDNSVDQFERSLLEILGDSYLLGRRKKLALLKLNQKSRIQVKSLERYFLKDVTLNASRTQKLKTNMINFKNYKSRVDSENTTADKTITKFLGLALFNKKKSSTQFNETKGKLLLPTSGSILKATGEPFSSGTVPWNGILISSKPNENVRAVGKGTVIFADEFNHFQAVIIIDHGNRYFTIYGNLNAIDVTLGQKIELGDVIGQVGQTDTTNINGLYFEIRKAGTSLNSEQWFAN